MSFPRDYYYYTWYGKRWRPRQYPWQHFSGCCHGHLVARRVAPKSEIYIVQRVDTHRYGKLPDFEGHVPFKCAAISSSPSVLVVVTGISSPAFMFCWLIPTSHEWIKENCVVVDPHDEHSHNRKYGPNNQPFMRFTNAIGVNGKFYSLSSQGTLVVIENVVDISNDGRGHFKITRMGKTRAIPSVFCKGFRECLMESNGEILLVFLVFRKVDKVVDDVEVYKLCLDDLSWIKLESLDEKTLFIGEDCCISVCAEKVGCSGNCVYFTQQREGKVDYGWLEYDMKAGKISSAWTHNACSGTTKCMEWDEPIADEGDPDLAKNNRVST